MPHFTPTRALVVLTSLLVLSFLWTWGLPRPYIPIAPPQHNGLASQDKQTPAQTLPESLVGTGSNEDTGKGENAPTTPKPHIEDVPGPTKAAETSPETSCNAVRGADDVVVVLRTSKAEVERGLPAPLLKLLSCAPHALVFSDHQGEIDGHPIYDALDAVPNTTIAKHAEFIEYDKIRADQNHKPSLGAAEALDKWKWLPMVYKTATMAPNHRFYVFVEPDTSVSWTNLLQWLQRLDYRIPYYIGVPDTIDDTKYAQRGPGVVLSYGALQQYWPRYEELYTTKWESQVAATCCGDVVLGQAMKHARIEFYSAFGLLDPETPNNLIWGEKFWCTPVVSWHRLTETEANLFWNSQKTWTKNHGWANPYTHYNAYEVFIKPQLSEEKKDWDNVSSDTWVVAEGGRREKLAKQKAEAEEAQKTPPPKAPAAKQVKNPSTPNARRPNLHTRDDTKAQDDLAQAAADSPANCKAMCKRTEGCIQWKHTTFGDGVCHLGKALRLGAKVERSQLEKNMWTSGWILDRVKGLADEWGRCERAEWKFNQ